MGGPGAAMEVDDAVAYHIKVLESATLETHAGKYMNYDGTETPW